MTIARKLRQRLEIYWWVFTTILVLAVMSPIWINGVPYPFSVMNVVYIVVFVTFTRYIFFLRHTPLARNTRFKLVIIALSAVLVFILITSISDLNNYLQEKGLQDLVGHVRVDRQVGLMRYIQSQAIFFGVGSVIASILMPLRMIMSIWRTRNTPDKV